MAFDGDVIVVGAGLAGLVATTEIADAEASGFGGRGMHGCRLLEGTFIRGRLFSGRNAGRAAAKAAV